MKKAYIIILAVVLAYLSWFMASKVNPTSSLNTYPCIWEYKISGNISLRTKSPIYNLEVVAPKGLPNGYSVRGGYALVTYEKFVNKVIESPTPLLKEDLFQIITPVNTELVSAVDLEVSVESNCVKEPDNTPK